MVVSVGIDVSKDKHDCFIVSSDGEVLAEVFTIPNTMDGFHCLLQRIRDCITPQDKIKVGLEATGHYSYNLLGFLLDNGLATYVLNPLRTNLYRKSLSLRKTKPDRVDARTIASMLLSDAGLKPYFYFVLRCGTIPDSLQQAMKPVHVVGNRKHIRQDFPLGADDEAIVLILRDINTNRNHHNKSLQR